MDPIYFIEQGFKKFKNNYVKSSVMMLFYYLINYFLSLFFGVAAFSLLAKTVLFESVSQMMTEIPFGTFLMANSTVLMIIGTILFFINILIEYGYHRYFYNTVKNDDGDISDMFYGFTHIFKFIGLSFVKTFLICFGLMFCIVPGIILSLMYSMTSFICAEDGNKGIIQIMRESRQIMKGKMLSLFVVQILVYFIQLAMNTALNFVSFSSVLYSILYIAGASIIAAYSTSVYAVFFMEAKYPTIVTKTPIQKDSECDQSGGTIQSFEDNVFPESFEDFENNMKNEDELNNDNQDDENRFE